MLSVNVGVLGHVDSGKTSLAKALSTVSSTAAFDKSPQSHERGITLDLGFSAFNIDVSQEERFTSHGVNTLQVTLVDCPGHASLIRTVIGGAQIVDLVVLVVDACKGVQTQTAECLVVAEVIGKPLVVALNKVDAVQGASDDDRSAALRKMRKRMEGTMAQTRWPTAPIVEVAADPGACGLDDRSSPLAATSTVTGNQRPTPIGLDSLINEISKLVDVPDLRRRRSASDSTDGFLMFVDHCFAVKGQGTVLTGTVMRGRITVGENVCLADFLQTRRVKGIQMFRKPVPAASAGDRIGLCITQFDAENMERGVVCGESAGVDATATLIVLVNKVRFHKRPIEAGDKFHISVGHTTVMGTMRFFCTSSGSTAARYDSEAEYQHLDALPEESAAVYDSDAPTRPGQPLPTKTSRLTYFAVVLLDRRVTTFVGATVVAAHLDSDIHANICRLAAVGTVVAAGGALDAPDAWRSVRAVRYKHRRVVIDRVVDPRTVIVKGLVKPKEGEDIKAVNAQMAGDAQRFVGRQLHAVNGKLPQAASAKEAEVAPPPPDAVVGKIDGCFGQTGKVRAVFPQDVFTVPPAKGKGPVASATLDDTDEATETSTDTSAAKAPRIALYFYSKKYPFSQTTGLQQ